MSTIAPPALVAPAHPRDAAVAFPQPGQRLHGRRAADKPSLLGAVLKAGARRQRGRHAAGGTR